MVIVILYFSGTGNTKWAVNALQASITENGHKCDIISLEDDIKNPEEIIKRADVVGLAFPIYGASMPLIMKRFVESLGNTQDIRVKPVFIVTTAGYIDGFGPFAALRMLRNKGLKLTAYINIRLSNNVSTPKLKANFQTRENLKRRMDKGKLKIRRLASNVANSKKYIRNIGFHLIPGVFIRKATKKGQTENCLTLGVDNTRCSHCMTCVEHCPTKSVVFSDNMFKFLPSCTACMRCYNFCPRYAITFDGKYADPEIFKRYRGLESIL